MYSTAFVSNCILQSAVAQLVEHLTGDRRIASSRLPQAESLCCVLEQNTLSAA